MVLVLIDLCSLPYWPLKDMLESARANPKAAGTNKVVLAARTYR